jgi:hypothetical protein
MGSGAVSVARERTPMLPNSLSASSIKTFLGCPSRYVAENFRRGSNFQGSAANLGSALHGALEDFVRGVRITKHITWDEALLLELYREHYIKILGPDVNTDLYRDGHRLLIEWFNRSYTFDDIFGRRIISLEAKNFIEIPVLYQGGIHKLTLNYIMDRFDDLGDGAYAVVDYKSQRIPWTADELRDNIQARVYALVAQTLHPDAKRIWVEFDFLRHEKVGVVFTKEDNVATWKMLKVIAQQVIDTDENAAPERLNPECMFCVKKATCETLQKNTSVGGIMGLSLDEMATTYADVSAQLKALEGLKGELEKQLLLHAADTEQTEFETDGARVKVQSVKRRSVDPERLARIIGEERMAEISSPTVSIADVDRLLKDPTLPEAAKAGIRTIITKKVGNPFVRVTRKK